MADHGYRVKRRPSAQEKKITEQSVQLRRFKRGNRDEREALHSGVHGTQWKALSQILRTLTLSEVMYLPEYIERQDWLRDADDRTRQTALTVIHDAIIRERIRNGYSPMDDGLADQPPTAFELIRRLLKVD